MEMHEANQKAGSPVFDEGSRRRLMTRFGTQAEAWFDKLPHLLASLQQKWQFELGPQIPRGSVSVVFRCRTADGHHAVLKVSPDIERLAFEGGALKAWHTTHTPKVIAADDKQGALLIEGIEPGTPLDVSAAYPPPESIARLLNSLHESGTPDPSYPTVARRADYLFNSSAKLYQLHPELKTTVTEELYERGRRLASRMAEEGAPQVLLHGDLTPSNVLDGGASRGLVAVDPAPCIGDAAFDAVDLIFWQADDLTTIETRTAKLAELSGIKQERLFGWCLAFAAMSALDVGSQQNGSRTQFEAFRKLALQV